MIDYNANTQSSEVVLEVKNLSKIYRLGEVGTGTISHDLNRWWAKVRGKEDPFAQVGTTNDRTQKAQKGEYAKVLSDINFALKKGEILGVIGKNGAGKSTLLKVISQITAPTTGSIKAKGRIASLLEVGTGMHPEMTGKENVYLNGTILGMTKKEIDSKYDEIMEFAGCAKYEDTPVKRYSSGMKVRLGFAVAAFLEPEILIVDEVLAVGDAEFQKKAIGKMQDISSGGGRTVIFVSHNMASIQQLCTRAIVLENGSLIYGGSSEDCISKYLNIGVERSNQKLSEREDRIGKGLLRFKDYSIKKTKSQKELFSLISGDDVTFEFSFEGNVKLENVNFRIQFFDEKNNLKFLCNNLFSSKPFSKIESSNLVHCRIPKFPLCKGIYYVNLRCRANNQIQDDIEYAFEVTVEDGDFFNTGNVQGLKDGILVNHSWELITN